MDLNARSLKQFSNSFIRHVSRFIKQAKLSPEGSAYIAVSGGMDSMALLYVLHVLKIRGEISNVMAMHVNHGTRVENDEEQELVEYVCSRLDIKLHTKKLSLNSGQSNFEHVARSERYKFFDSLISKEDRIYTGHHINDSFEWSLMQQMKSSKLESSLGIPVKSGKTYRPFLCVTRDQITRFVVQADIPYMDDPSNEEVAYERNYLRNLVIPMMVARDPKYLKHYAHRQNELARMMELSVFDQKSSSALITNVIANKVVTLVHPSYENDFSSYEDDIVKAIEYLSSSERGSIRNQVHKLIQSCLVGKVGPLIYSGKVKSYCLKGMIIFVNEEGEKYYSHLDKKLLSEVEQQTTQIPGGVDGAKRCMGRGSLAPYLLIGPISNHKLQRGVKKAFPLLPRTTQKAIDKGLWLQFATRILWDSRKSHKCNKLIYVKSLQR